MTAPANKTLAYYFGGKWNLALWTIGHFPPPEDIGTLVETHGGMASISMRIDPMPANVIYNDLNGNSVNYLEVLATSPDALIDRLRHTAHSRQLRDYALENYETHPSAVERARLYFIILWESIGGSSAKGQSSYKTNRDISARGKSAAADIADVSHLYLASARLKNMQIECLSAERILLKYDHPKTLFYIDPTYLAKTRVNKSRYQFEMSPADHEYLSWMLKASAGRVVLCGYPSAEYASWYESAGWRRYEKEAATNGGGSRTECLWLNPAAQAASRMATQAAIF